MNLLLIWLVILATVEGSCPCCENGELVHVDHRCNTRLNQVPPPSKRTHNKCKNVSVATVAAETQLAALQAEITNLEEEVALLESVGDFTAAVALEAELEALQTDLDSLDAFLTSTGAACVAEFNYEAPLAAVCDFDPSGGCLPIDLLQVSPTDICPLLFSYTPQQSFFFADLITSITNLKITGFVNILSASGPPPFNLNIVFSSFQGRNTFRTSGFRSITITRLNTDVRIDITIPLPGNNNIYNFRLGGPSTFRNATVRLNVVFSEVT